MILLLLAGATVLDRKGKSLGFFFFLSVFFEDLIHLNDQFAHDRGQGDFGGFGLLVAQTLVELSQRRCFLFLPGQYDRAHVEGVAHPGATATDVALAFPGSALADPWGQAGQGCGLSAVKRSQLGHVSQRSDCCDEAHAGHLVQSLDLLPMMRRVGDSLSQLFFRSFNLSLKIFAEFSLGFEDERAGKMFGLEAQARQLLLELGAPIHQSAQMKQRGIGFGGGRGLMGLAIGSEERTIQWIAFGTAALGQGEVADMAGIEDGNGTIGGLQGGDDRSFIAAGGFTNHLDLRRGLDQGQQFFMPCASVREGMLLVLEVKLEGGFGDIQTGIDCRGRFRHNRNSCSAHSCTYERVVLSAAQSTVRVTDNSASGSGSRTNSRKRFKRATSASAPPLSGLQAGERDHLPVRVVTKQER